MPTGPAILWNDGRAASYVDRWQADGVLERGTAISGCTTFPGLANAILRWLEDAEPARVDGAAALLSCSGWLYSRLTGRVRAEISDAAAPFLDPVAGDYSPELLRLYGLEHRAHLLPEIVSGPTALAPLTPDAAARIGVPAGVPVLTSRPVTAARAVATIAARPAVKRGRIVNRTFGNDPSEQLAERHDASDIDKLVK